MSRQTYSFTQETEPSWRKFLNQCDAQFVPAHLGHKLYPILEKYYERAQKTGVKQSVTVKWEGGTYHNDLPVGA